MESDAFASFVTVDMELQAPLFAFGFLGQTEYADLDDSPADAGGDRPRRHRHSLEVLKRATQFWKAREVSFVAHLGNVLAAETAQAQSQFGALRPLEEEREKLHPLVGWHVAPGAHDLACFGAAGLGAALKPSRDEGSSRTYYAFFPCPAWRVLVLDAFDVSLLAHEVRTPAHASALELLRSQNPNAPDAADPLAGLEGLARRWSPSGGGLGAAQLTWLSAQLSIACAEGQRVIVLCHLGVNPEGCAGERLLFNYDEVQMRLGAYPGVVSLVLAAGDAEGSYVRDTRGVHYLCPAASVRCDVNEDAYGVLQVYHDRLKVSMKGIGPAVLSTPRGWPAELTLPHGGTLASGGAGGAASDGLMFLWWTMLYLMSRLALPFQPVFSALGMSAGADADADADARGAPGGGGGKPGEPPAEGDGEGGVLV